MTYLAQDARQVPDLTQTPHNRRYVAIRMHEAHDPTVVAVATRRQNAPAWLADGNRHVGSLESHTLGGKVVDVRRKARHLAIETAYRITV
jgi:hypothetical protein